MAVSNELTVGQKIRKARRAKDMTQEELANKVGVTKATINRYETGVITQIPRSKIELLAQALEMSPVDFFNYQAVLDNFTAKMRATKEEIAQLESKIDKSRHSTDGLKARQIETEKLEAQRDALKARLQAYEVMEKEQYNGAISEMLKYPGPETEAPVQDEAAEPERYKVLEIEADDFARELLLIYKKLPVRKKMQLLNQAYALEDEEAR